MQWKIEDSSGYNKKCGEGNDRAELLTQSSEDVYSKIQREINWEMNWYFATIAGTADKYCSRIGR